MKPIQLMCQNCNTQYEKIKDFKAHVRNYRHKQEVTKLFQTAIHKGPVYFPMLVFLDYLRNPDQTDPLIGFDMVTMFITPEKIGAIYLCHVCEEQLSTGDVVGHLCSVQHYFRYLAYTSPELLHFAWLDDSFSYLKSSAVKEYNTNGSGNLRVLELPKMMLKRCKKLPYHQVMAVFSKTDKLMERIQAGIPRRKSIQEYIADPARANPLLGLNLLIEYSCPKYKGYCGYLCILCKKKISATQSISHCISFDHVYWYLKAAHPATLDSPKSSYSHYSYSFLKKILYLANQAQTLCPPTEIQSVQLDLERFKDVNSSSYANALEKLQGIQRERNQNELNVTITPGERLTFAPEDHDFPASATTIQQQEEKSQMECLITQTKDDPPCRILCVECDQTLNFITDYKQHVKGKHHKQKLVELFGPGQYIGRMSQIKLYQYMWNRHGKTSSSPLIGLPLLTVFVQRQSADNNTPFYLCHACELNIPVSSASVHLTSTHHFFNVFAYSKPDLVFLGSQNLVQFAQEEERSQGKQKMVLKVCELPSQQFGEFRPMSYEKLMETIGTHSSKLKRCIQVEKRVTLQSYSKSCERKSPLLGLQFMVKYATNQHSFRCSYLCLLCEKKLPERHATAHVLSFSHIFTYLDMAHPGSLCKEDSEKVSLILDLAEQAEKIPPDMTLREVDVSVGKFNEIEKCSFKSAVNVLQGIFRNKGLGELKPSVVPGARLVSGFETNKNNSSKCDKQEHTSSDTEKPNIVGACPDTSMPKTEENTNSEYPDLLLTEHKELQKTTHISTQVAEDPMSSQCPIISLPKEQSEPLKLDLKPLNQERLPDPNSTEDAPTVKHPQPGDSSAPQHKSAKLAPNPITPVQALQKPVLSPVCLKAKTPAVPQTHLPTCTELRRYLKMPNRQPVIGLKSVIECCTVDQRPFYVCTRCVEKFEESSIIKHLLTHNHRLQYLKNTSYGPEPGKKKVTTKWLRAQAYRVEKMEGSGEAGTLKLDAKDYHEIFNASILNALAMLKDSLLKMTSDISAQSPKAICSDNIKCDENHGPETLKMVRETEDKVRPHAQETVKSRGPEKEPETPQQNPDDPDNPARSSPDLWSYLTSATRTEPVIGLSVVTEYRNPNGQNSFLCSCCNKILATKSYVGHLISPGHRFNYIKSKHPKIVASWKGEINLTCKIAELQQKAQILQDTEGWGCLKVVEKENKPSPKLTMQASEDTKTETLAKVQKEEPSQASRDAGPQDPKSSKQNPTKEQNMKNTNKRNAVIDAENSAKVQKLEPSQTGCDAEPQERESHEPKPTKQQNKKKKNGRNAVIGLNFVTCVHHGKKKLFFCEICNIRGHLDHLSSVTHFKTYLEHKYPGCTARGPNTEKKLRKIVVRLAAVERSTGIGMKKLNVTDKVFTALRTAPLTEALRQLKLLQTKPEDGVDLKTSQLELSTFSDNEHGPCNNSVDHILCSTVTTNSSQQEKPPLLENQLVPELYVSSCRSSHISPPPLLHSTISSDLTSLIHVPPPISSQPERRGESSAQCLIVPHPLYEPVSPPSASDCQDVANVSLPSYAAPPVYEPISAPPAEGSMDLTDVAPPCSSMLPTPDKLTHHMECEVSADGPAHYETGPVASTSHAKLKGTTGSDLSQSAVPCSAMSSYFTCSQREESNILHDTAPSKTYSLPNLPTVLEKSHASIFLKVKGISDTDPIIGLSNILECRRISRPTFFLCLNCTEKVSRENFCEHMTSEEHQRLSIRTQYHEIFQHWQWETVQQMTIRELAEKLALAEKGSDAKVIKLNQYQYESMCTADFHDAIEILQRMFGPCSDESSQPLHPAGKNQISTEIPTVKTPPESVERERDHQSQQSCDNTTPIHKVPSSQVQLKEVNSAQGNLGRNTSTQSQSSPKPLPECEAQTPQPQLQSVVQIDLTDKSDSRKSSLCSPKPVTNSKRSKENHAIDCPNLNATETPESAAIVSSRENRPAHTLHTPKIKQEKNDEVFCVGENTSTPTMEAKSSKEPTGNGVKHPDLKYIKKPRTEADAVVGLSAVIECRSEGQASLCLCASCSSKFNHDLINHHLVKPGHRYSYLKRRYPSLFEDWSDYDDEKERSKRLMKLAYNVEMTNEDEPGQRQVMNLNCADLQKIKSMSYDKAIKYLQQIRKEQNLCPLKTCISHKITKNLIKQETMEIDVTTQYSTQLPGRISQGLGRAFKRRAVEKDVSGKEQGSDVQSSHTKQSPAIGKNQEPSDCPVKRSKVSNNDSDSVTQLHKESSVLTTNNPNRSSITVPETSRSSPTGLDPSSQTYKRTTSIDETALKNSKKQESPSSIIASQQKNSCPSTSAISALSSMKGQEIARLSEKRHLVKTSLSENAWSYESRQFSPETPCIASMNPVADSSAETEVMSPQGVTYSMHNYNKALNPHCNWKIPDKNGLDPNLTHNANADMYLSTVSRYGTATSVTSQVAPEYAVSHQYLMYNRPDNTSVIAVSNTMAPADERALNYEAAAPNCAYFTNTNPAHSSPAVYQSQLVYQPVQSFQDLETYQAYYACYSYNQALHTNQMATDNK